MPCEESYLHRHCARVHADILSSLPDQGKVARCLKTTNFPSTNSWLFDGTGLSSCDWRFIHRARTNTLPTNAVKNRFGYSNFSEYRNCHSKIDAETLPHIICRCNPNMTSITKRHDKILDRLSKVIHRGSFTIDKVIPGAPDINRPDLVLTDGNKVTIVDVTCPFENDQDAYHRRPYESNKNTISSLNILNILICRLKYLVLLSVLLVHGILVMNLCWTNYWLVNATDPFLGNFVVLTQFMAPVIFMSSILLALYKIKTINYFYISFVDSNLNN